MFNKVLVRYVAFGADPGAIHASASQGEAVTNAFGACAAATSARRGISAQTDRLGVAILGCTLQCVNWHFGVSHTFGPKEGILTRARFLRLQRFCY
jgi:hypothetical protein